MNIHQELEKLRPALVRFAMLQLRDDALAQDAVQDTLLAVLEHPDRYSGASSLRTYVTGILKHKIIDSMRSGKRVRQFDTHDDQSEDELIEALFDANDHAFARPVQWGNPDSTLEQKDFFRILEICLERLPEKTARIFMMREWLEIDTEEICKELSISTSNAWVMLYRARVRLRECLDINWFGQAASR